MKEYKTCKGIGKAKDFKGCNKEVLARTRKYGLCQSCFREFLLNTSQGQQIIKDQSIKSQKERIKTERSKLSKKKKDMLTVQDWMKIAQVPFNAFIRERDKGKKCISCDKILKGKFDSGHFYSSGGHKYITYHEDNVHGQCVHCNQHKHGNIHEYRKGLIVRIGQERLDHLDSIAQKTANYTIQELEEIANKYKQKLKDLKNK